jgi:translation elongation factor P/translation initiation factor 5A
MKKQAKDLKKGDKIILGGQTLIIEDIEISDIGKHGKRKVRIEAKKPDKEKTVIIRPDNYPFDCS